MKVEYEGMLISIGAPYSSLSKWLVHLMNQSGTVSYEESRVSWVEVMMAFGSLLQGMLSCAGFPVGFNLFFKGKNLFLFSFWWLLFFSDRH